MSHIKSVLKECLETMISPTVPIQHADAIICDFQNNKRNETIECLIQLICDDESALLKEMSCILIKNIIARCNNHTPLSNHLFYLTLNQMILTQTHLSISNRMKRFATMVTVISVCSLLFLAFNFAQIRKISFFCACMFFFE